MANIGDRLGERLVNLVWAHLPMHVEISAYGPMGPSTSTDFRMMVRTDKKTFVHSIPCACVMDAVKIEELDGLAHAIALKIVSRIKKGK